ncbi:MAG: quinohemoprotein amine dehydrogenase subunit gamma [Thioalkalivibrio sp.]|nr:quinohemoprotein amine dehydrogenase subunit gamma [Thioalkalivibrio sp.]
MRRIKAINQKAVRIERYVEAEREVMFADGAAPSDGDVELDVVGLESSAPDGPHIPFGCTLMFSPGWETDSGGGTAGLCQPVERDLFDCHLGCFWPAQVPDQLNNAADWTSKCAAAQKDWRKLDLVFP